MPSRPIVLVHGYGADGDAFDAWRRVLADAGRTDLHLVEYACLSDDVTLDDLAEGLERALRLQAGLAPDAPFDALVHSTGMLVVRAWLVARPERRARLKRLVALAPATFGSPLAHKGRGMLSAVFNGNRRFGPDFLEAGDAILRSLELASPDTWALAERDMLGEEAFYGPHADTPFVFVLCGADGYDFPLSVVNGPATDGAVRLAGCGLTSRKITLDLTRDAPPGPRATVRPWTHVDVPVVPIEGCHHGTILADPPREARALVLAALAVDDARGFGAWLARAGRHRDAVARRRRGGPGSLDWQQIVIRVRDERGRPVPDYYVEFLAQDRGGGAWRPIRDAHPGFVPHVHVHGDDPSYRCFHVDLGSAPPPDRPVGLRLLAHSGTDLVGYHGHLQRLTVADGRGANPGRTGAEEAWHGLIDLGSLARGTRLFHPLTTTLVEIRLDREPLPVRGRNRLVRARRAPRPRT